MFGTLCPWAKAPCLTSRFAISLPSGVLSVVAEPYVVNPKGICIVLVRGGGGGLLGYDASRLCDISSFVGVLTGPWTVKGGKGGRLGLGGLYSLIHC